MTMGVFKTQITLCIKKLQHQCLWERLMDFLHSHWAIIINKQLHQCMAVGRLLLQHPL